MIDRDDDAGKQGYCELWCRHKSLDRSFFETEGGVRVKVLMMWWFPPYRTPLTAGEGHKRICKSWMTCATRQTRGAWRDSRMAYFFSRMIPMSLRVYFS